MVFVGFFFFKQKTAYSIRISDWSSDVCSSDLAAPLPGEAVVAKRLPNAFSGTELHELLQKLGRLDLIVCGFMTHSSISTTVRAAKDYGYRCTLVDSACATRNLPMGEGSIDAEQVHRIEMTILADNFAGCVQDAAALAR